jgi:hypothetical protein
MEKREGLMAYKGNDRDILVSCGGKKLFEGTLMENVTLQAVTRHSYSFDVT